MNHPDFSAEGYRVVRELGRDREGSRVAWLATELETERKVVIKQFCFGQAGAGWLAYREQEREIRVLKRLRHPGIPEYLGAFVSDDGFSLVQEYKNAQSLATQRSFTPEEIKQIALKALDILIYLQDRIPLVLHRNINPETVLVDEQLNVYLIDFGMSPMSSQKVAAGSVFQGTHGFIPPEQLHKPTAASDLYGLGATLICLLTDTKSTQIQDLIDKDDPYLLHFRNLFPRLNPLFLDWLETMVKPQLKERFPDAQTALQTLKPLDVKYLPESESQKRRSDTPTVVQAMKPLEKKCVPAVKFRTSPSLKTLTTHHGRKLRMSQLLEFTAICVGERLARSIEVLNTTDETLLEGKWEVAPHPHDPPHTTDEHSWIEVSPREFEDNEISCEVSVDTSKLMAGKFYERELLLWSNADVGVHYFTIRVQTAPIPIEQPLTTIGGLLVSLLSFAGLFSASYTTARLMTTEVGLSAVLWAGLLTAVWAFIWLRIADEDRLRAIQWARNGAMIGATLGAGIGYGFGAGAGIGAGIGILVGAWYGQGSTRVNSSPLEEYDLKILASNSGKGAVIGIMFGAVVGLVYGGYIGSKDVVGAMIGSFFGAMIGAGVGLLLGAIIGSALGKGFASLIDFGGKKLALSTAGFGIALGIVLTEAIRITIFPQASPATAIIASDILIIRILLNNPFILLLVCSTGTLFVGMLIYYGIHRSKLLTQYRRSEEHLIKP